MGRPSALGLVTAALLATFAGCAEDASKGQGVHAATSSLMPGSVAGIVVDDSLAPVSGADVGIASAGLNLTTSTAADGRFLFSDVPPGSYEAVATKLGFVTARQRVTLGSGESLSQLQLQLEAIPDPKEAHSVPFIGNGFISCAVKIGAFTLTTVQVCEADPQNQQLYEFEVWRERGLVSLVLELAWQPSAPGTATDLRHELWKNPRCTSAGTCDPEIRYFINSGPSPLRKVLGNSTEAFLDSVAVEGPTRLHQFAHVSRAEEPIVVVVVQQPVTHYITAFYNSVPAPDYTLVP